MQYEDIESLLNSLPSFIKIYDTTIEAEFDSDHYIYYAFDLGKDDGVENVYELSYFCYLWEKELISFKGSLHDVAEKMVAWCKLNGYVK